MRLALLVSLLFASIAVWAVEDDAPRKRGGFTGATPKPVAKKKRSAASADNPKATADDATPAPKRKLKKTDADLSEEKKPAPASDATEKTKRDQITEPDPAPAKREHAPAATVAPEDIAEFAGQPPRVQALITAALELTKLNLAYTYGSDDPAQGGMDCSGTMAYLLRSQGFKDVPRDSSSQYVWTRRTGPFFAVVSKSAESFEFQDLRPGDLMFWTGTYETGREIPISHVMLYLGTEKKTRKRIMFGSSDGRSYDGIQRWGVSVFDFKMPKSDLANGEKSKVDFVGYGRIPALFEPERATAKAEPASPMAAEATPTPAPSPVVKKPSTGKKKRSGSSTRKSMPER